MPKFAKGLINLGLAAIPFVFWPGVEQFRTPKETVALSLSLFIGCLAAYAGILGRFKNRWVLAFVFWSLLSIYLAPQFPQFKLAYLIAQDQFRLVLAKDLGNFWNWKIMCQILIYFGLIWTVSSLKFRARELNKTLWICALAGVVMSLYVFIQAAGWDPLFRPDQRNIDLAWLSRPALGGVIGHSTLVSPFIGMTLPLAIYFKKWVWVAAMVLALF